MELDFSRSLHYFWALMPEMILCAWGMVVLLAGVSRSLKEAAEAEGLPIGGDMKGHPPLAPYVDQGFQIITI